MSEYDARAFDAYEAAGWDAIAGEYDALWSEYTSQAVDPLLDAADVRSGMRVLDIGTGSGHAAAQAAARGAEATGIDVAAAMVEIATRNHPEPTFVQASATQLPFPDASFDAVVGNIVIQHIGEPERAASESARVLTPQGRISLSTWDGPEHSPFFAVLLGAVGDAEIPPPTEVPPGPSFVQFADPSAFSALLEGAGFTEVTVGSAEVSFPIRSANEMVRALAEGTVRTGALVRAADDAQLRRVHESLAARLEPWRRGDSYVVPASVRIASGRKS